MQKKGLIILLLLLFPTLLLGQGMKIKGKLVDLNGEPLIGANVSITELSIGAASDIDGVYAFEIPSELVKNQEVVVKASYIGYKSTEEVIVLRGGTLTLDFTLEEDVFQSEEVVVTGIASRTSKAVAEVAVSRVDVSKLTAKQNYQGFSQLVSGKIAGVQLQTGSGNVGSGWRFNIRAGGGLNGTGQPVVYVDGVRINNAEIEGYGIGGQTFSLMSNLNVDDIENIEVLKGPAAAAMYGTDGSNGVVLITTKSGKGMSSDAKNYTIDYKYTYGLNTQGFHYDEDKFLQGNKLNEILEENGIIREHSISISGGNNSLRYYASYAKRKEEGLIPHQNYMDRNSMKLNLTTYPSSNITVSLNTNYVWNEMRRPENDNSTWGWILNTLVYNPPYSRMDSLSIAQTNDQHNVNQFIGSAKISYTPLPNLEINAGAGIDYNNWRQDQLYPYGFYRNSKGYRNLYTRNAHRLTYDFNARYNSSFFNDKLKITSIAGSQILEGKTTTLFASLSEFANPDIIVISAANQVDDRGDSRSHFKKAGIYFDNNFAYDNTYFLSLGIRKDYASAVGSESPSIVYPKASFSVRLDKFGFLPKEIELLKLRAAYGESGQLPLTDDGVALTWTGTAGGSGVGATIESIGNTKIEPERIKEFEVGLDIEFLKMFSAEFTAYFGSAENSIINAFYAPSSGLGDFEYPFNIGSVENSGFESMLQFNPIRTSDYNLNMTFIYNYQTNEVTDIGESDDIIRGWLNVLKPGLAKFEFYDYVSAGANFNDDGTYKSAKRSDEKIALGNPIPPHSGSVSVNFRFLKNFNFSALAEYSSGNKVWSYTIRRMITTDTYRPALETKAAIGLTTKLPEIERLQPGTQAYIDAANKYAKYYHGYYGNFVYDADYIVLRELSLSYDFTDIVKEHFAADYVSSVIVGFSARNVAKWSNYDLDPEVNRTGGQTQALANDFATLPQPRTYNFWVKFGF